MKTEGQEQEWVIESTKWLLEKMGYNTDEDINAQFLKKYHKEFSERPLPSRRPPGPKKGYKQKKK